MAAGAAAPFLPRRAGGGQRGGWSGRRGPLSAHREERGDAARALPEGLPGGAGLDIAMRRGTVMPPAAAATARRVPRRRDLREETGRFANALRGLAARPRAGGQRSSGMTDATITVTSLADGGRESVLPVIHPPQVAIPGIGRILGRPWVVDGRVAPRRAVTLTLAADRRASDGHRGGLLLARIAPLLRSPEAP